MKRRITVIISLVLVAILSLTAISSAAQPYSNNTPRLMFNGTTANCYVEVTSFGDDISVTLTLRYGGTRCATWYANGTSTVIINEAKEVTPGHTYTLTVSGTINGKPFEMGSVTAVCN